MNKALHQTDTIKVRLRNQNKRRLPQMLHRSPIDPNWAPLLINWKTKQHNEQGLHRAPPWARLHHLHWHHQHLHLVLEVICESRGLSNLTPSRSRLFKLMGKVKGMRWSCSKRLAYMVAKHTQMRARREGKAHSIKLWSRSDPRTTYVKHNSNTVFTSRTPPERDHHGYTRGWCILIKVIFRFSTTGH